MKGDAFTVVVRIALAIGFCIDGLIGLFAIFAPKLMETLFDVPITDVTTAQIAGGEFIVVALVYGLAFRDPRRFRALLWLCALDQLFAVILPTVALMHGALPATWKIIAPIPFQALLALLFAVYAARPGRNASATPFMQ